MYKATLAVKDLRVSFEHGALNAEAVRGVSLSVDPGEIVGIAGESGCGKSLTALSMIGLPPDNARVSGFVEVNGELLAPSDDRAWRDVRGRSIGIVFQNPMTHLHPMLSIGDQLTEHMKRHLGVSRRQAATRAMELLDEVRIPNPARTMKSYPHQFSGGMRQRVCIAMALACEPDVLIADEPTTALDVTVQAGILHLLERLRSERGLSIVLISHDLGVIGAICDRLYIFYAGRIVESGSAVNVLTQPRHPYTIGLLEALPRSTEIDTQLIGIPGRPPSPTKVPPGCAFHPRCDHMTDKCRKMDPELEESDIGGQVACWHWKDLV